VKGFVFKYCLILTIAWIVLIFILCATPGQYIPTAGWMELLSIDKLIHATIFFVLTSLFLITASKYNYANHPMIYVYVLICIIYGGILEIMQAYYFTNRSADWLDVIANTVGCVAALTALKRLRRNFLTGY
jgi:hypothetical protein